MELVLRESYVLVTCSILLGGIFYQPIEVYYSIMLWLYCFICCSFTNVNGVLCYELSILLV
jgi:hypothetical protein